MKTQLIKTNIENLVETLSKYHYWKYLYLLGDGNVRAYDWKKVSESISGDEKILWDFFLNLDDISIDDFSRLLSEGLLEYFEAVGLLRIEKDRLKNEGYLLIQFSNRRFFINPSGFPYFADDIKSFFLQNQPSYLKRISSFNLQTGVELYHLLKEHPEKKLSISYKDSKNLLMLKLNMELNLLEEQKSRVDFVQEDIAYQNENYDLICGRIPSFPTPEGLEFPASFNGGTTGFDFFEKRLQSVATSLSDNGVFDFNFVACYSDDFEALTKTLGNYFKAFNLSLHLTCISKFDLYPGIPVLNSILGVASHTNPDKSIEDLINIFNKHFEQNNIRSIYLLECEGFLDGNKKINTGVVDFSDKFYGQSFV